MPKPRSSLLGNQLSPAQMTSLLGDGSVMSSYDPTFREKATDYLRSLLFSDDREGQRKAEKVSNLFETVTPYGVATGIDDASEAYGDGDYLGAGAMLSMAGLPGPSPKGIKAFHGSPHSFDKFSMDKIGTGEGAQAYGHGLYFAENEGVAKGYRDALKPGAGTGPEDTASRVLDLHGGDRDAAMASLRETIDRAFSNGTDYAEVQRLMQAKNILNTTPHVASGSMYEVNIDADPESFLDWDAPLSAQPEPVRKALDEMGWLGTDAMPEGYYNQTAGNIIGSNRAGKFDATGGDVYAAMVDAKGKPGASPELLGKGIPGIKYLDAGSRAKGDGSRNYVVFDDKLISIVRKYGIAGASAMLGYNILDGMNEEQAAELQSYES